MNNYNNSYKCKYKYICCNMFNQTNISNDNHRPNKTLDLLGGLRHGAD